MTTPSPWAHAHDPPISADVYDPDDVVPKNSPLFEPRKGVDLRPSPSSSLELQMPEEDRSPSPPRGSRKSRRSKSKANPGDAVLVYHLATGGRYQDTATTAGLEPLASDTSEEGMSLTSADSGDDSESSRSGRPGDRDPGRRRSGEGRGSDRQLGSSMPVDACSPTEAPVPLDDLQSLATSALGALGFGGHREVISENASRTPTNLNISSIDRRKLIQDRSGRRDTSFEDLEGEKERDFDFDRERDDRQSVPSATSPYSPRSSSAYSHSPLQSSLSPMHTVSLRSPTAIPRNVVGELPPIQDVMSPRSETNGSHNPLPSIRDTFGDLSFKESSQDGRSPYPHSPPGGLPRIAGLTVGSPPLSPNEAFRRGELPSPAPHLSAATSPYYPHHPHVNGFPRHSVDYSSSSATETPGSTGDYATPAGSGPERMSADGLTTAMGTFVCKFPGCTALPFHTQYLLNSHRNVHSSVRPHYCPVKGCSRSEGGKGFKRKNEMIRHGLVHDSPGYICPFCPDREHKYPRPDNLQRHVRVHHVDKDKDDPMLRDVLAQRPDGPNRGRRRRHGGPA